MRHKILEAGLSDKIEVDSAGTISYHSEEFADPRTLAILDSHNIRHPSSAREVKAEDIHNFDLIIAMASDHVNYLNRLVPSKYHSKIKLFLSFAPELGITQVPDPYHSGGFEAVYEMIEVASKNLLSELLKTLRISS